MNQSAKSQAELTAGVKLVCAAEMSDPRLCRIYITEEVELPDAIKNHPKIVQRDYMRTYNNNLRRFGDVSLAMMAGNRAAQNRIDKLRRDREEKWRGLPTGFDWERLMPLKAQIVVP